MSRPPKGLLSRIKWELDGLVEPEGWTNLNLFLVGWFVFLILLAIFFPGSDGGSEPPWNT
jgi:hypothetical protein